MTPEKTQIKKAPHKRPTGKRRRKASKTSTTFAQPKAPVPHTAVANPSASASFSARESGRTVLNDHGSFPTILPLTEKNYFAEIMDKNNGSTHGSVVIRNSGHLVSATESTTTVEKGRSRRASKHDEVPAHIITSWISILLPSFYRLRLVGSSNFFIFSPAAPSWFLFREIRNGLF